MPVYLAVLLLLKGMRSAADSGAAIRSVAPCWIPAEGLFSLLLVLALCFLVGVACVLERGARFASAWRMCSSRDFPGTACCAV